MELIELRCRGIPLILIKKDILYLSDQDWFFSLLLKYTDSTEPIELCEDIDIVKSIIETLRYKKLILYNNISLEHMEMLCDKWCVPIWIIEEIEQQKKDKPLTVYVNNETIHMCKNCRAGFKMSENTNTSCRFHKSVCDVNMIFRCCNQNEPCISGYHIPMQEPNTTQ